MSEYTAKPLKYSSLPGLSEKQLSEHHDVLYTGYVKKIGAIRAALAKTDKSQANPTSSDWRALKVEESFALNGVILHERYFDGMTAEPRAASGPIAEMLAADFGSIEAWAEDMLACGLAARGWVVLAFDLNDGKLHNYVCDLHNQGGVWGAVPLVVLDVYEHAYFIDYATGRKSYLEKFLKMIDWSVANGIIEKFGLEKRR